MRRLVVTLLAMGTFGCTGPDKPVGVLGDLVGRSFGLPHSELPPIYSACGRVQPGYDIGDPDDPTDDKFEGVPYDELHDPFCSLTFTREFSQDEDDGTVYLDEYIYVIELGEPDPESPYYTPDAQEYMFEGGLYCSFHWTVEANAAPSLADAYDQDEVQDLTYTLAAVTPRCSKEVSGSIFEIGVQLKEYAYCSTRDDIFLFLPDPTFAAWQGYPAEGGEGLVPDVRFQGFAGIPEGGGGMAWPDQDSTGDDGWMTYYEECEPSSNAAEGPGYCLPASCRLFSESLTMPACTWDDVAALPCEEAEELVLPEWHDAFPSLFETAYE